jgi:hypothetical protein
MMGAEGVTLIGKNRKVWRVEHGDIHLFGLEQLLDRSVGTIHHEFIPRGQVEPGPAWIAAMMDQVFQANADKYGLVEVTADEPNY